MAKNVFFYIYEVKSWYSDVHISEENS